MDQRMKDKINGVFEWDLASFLVCLELSRVQILSDGSGDFENFIGIPAVLVVRMGMERSVSWSRWCSCGSCCESGSFVYLDGP